MLFTYFFNFFTNILINSFSQFLFLKVNSKIKAGLYLKTPGLKTGNSPNSKRLTLNWKYSIKTKQSFNVEMTKLNIQNFIKLVSLLFID